MNRRLTTFALVFAAAALSASAYLMAAPGATTVPADGTERTLKPPVAKVPAPTAAEVAAPQVAKATATPTPPAKPAVTISAARPPVPLLVSPRNTYVAPTPEQAKAAETSVVEKAAPSDAAAKAAIEADGYKRVTGLAKGPDGKWRGRALRGTTEVAVSVDTTGSVSAD
jgi:hypothetical protein